MLLSARARYELLMPAIELGLVGACNGKGGPLLR